MSIFIERTGELIATVSFNLAVNISTTATPPVYATMLTLALTTVRPASVLDIRFVAAVRHVGVAGVNVAANFRLLLNGVLLPVTRGTTVNILTFAIMPVVIERRVDVTAGLQTVVVEWAKFAGPFNTLIIDPVTLPDLSGAQLVLQEQAT